MRCISRLIALAAVAAASVLVAGACGEDEPTIVDIEGSEFTFTAPETIEAGTVTINFSNTGQQLHHLVLARLPQGMTFAEAQPLLADPDAPPPPGMALVGGGAPIDPGRSTSATAVLSAGTYLMLCFIPDSADGVPHIAKGMIGSFTVTGDAADAELAEAQGTVRMKDFSFDMPSISSGPLTLRVVNDGPQDHEFAILRLAPGKSMRDVYEFFNALESGSPPAGPQPFAAVGGVNALSKGLESNVNLDLDAGEYVAICGLPDEATGQSHAALGMVRPFTVK